jgi:hypothetical protein
MHFQFQGSSLGGQVMDFALSFPAGMGPMIAGFNNQKLMQISKRSGCDVTVDYESDADDNEEARRAGRVNISGSEDDVSTAVMLLDADLRGSELFQSINRATNGSLFDKPKQPEVPTPQVPVPKVSAPTPTPTPAPTPQPNYSNFRPATSPPQAPPAISQSQFPSLPKAKPQSEQGKSQPLSQPQPQPQNNQQNHQQNQQNQQKQQKQQKQPQTQNQNKSREPSYQREPQLSKQQQGSLSEVNAVGGQILTWTNQFQVKFQFVSRLRAGSSAADNTGDTLHFVLVFPAGMGLNIVGENNFKLKHISRTSGCVVTVNYEGGGVGSGGLINITGKLKLGLELGLGLG